VTITSKTAIPTYPTTTSVGLSISITKTDTSNYNEEHIKKIKPQDYKEKMDKFRLDKYEYCHDNLKHIVTERRKDDEDIHSRL
jgi:hypothetical protein